MSIDIISHKQDLSRNVQENGFDRDFSRDQIKLTNSSSIKIVAYTLGHLIKIACVGFWILLAPP